MGDASRNWKGDSVTDQMVLAVVHENNDSDLGQGSANEGGGLLDRKGILKLELQGLVLD